jgi:phosphoglycolate phosphatase
MVNGQKALIFDLDGTLVDTAPDLLEQLARVMRARDIDVPFMDSSLIGEGALHLIQRGFEAKGIECTQELLAEIEVDFLAGYDKNCTKHSKPYPDAVAILERIARAKIPMSVCTNKRQASAEKVLEGLNLTRFFQHITGRRDGFPAKPDTGALDDIAKAMELQPHEMVMVGDSKTDIDFAHNCGMKVIAVSFGYSSRPIETLGADYLIPHWCALPSALEKLSLKV